MLRLYIKKVEISSTGMVIASVYRNDGRRTGLKFFTPFFATIRGIERQAQKAHKWADKYCIMCQQQETD